LLSPGRSAESLAVLAHDHGGRLQPNADSTASSMKVNSAAIRLTTSSGVNIDAIAITSICAIQERTTPCLRSQYSDAGGRIVNVYRQGAAVFAL
jgi:hypothetical protein